MSCWINLEVLHVTYYQSFDDYLTRNLIFFDHTFYNNCVLIYKDMFIPISYGVGGKVFLTVDDNDLKRVLEHPDIKRLFE